MRKNTLPAFLLCQLAPHGCEDSAAIEISAFRRISGEADMSYFFSKKNLHISFLRKVNLNPQNS